MTSRRHVVSLAVLFGLCSGSAGLAQTQGWTYTMRMDSDSGNGAAHTQSIATQYRTIAHKFRSEYVQATGAMGAIEGTYQIFDDADSSMTIVMPAQHMATVMSLPGSLAMTGGGMKVGPTRVTRSEFVDLGAGEKVLGHSTHRYRMTMTGTMEWTMMGQSCVQPLDTQMDMWVAPDVDLGAAMGSVATVAAMAGPMPKAESDSPVNQMPKGSSLRTVMKSTRVDPAGAPHTVTSTMEIIELRYGPIGDDVFSVPVDYRKMDVRKMMASMPAGMMDSAMRSVSTDLMAKMCGAAGKP